MDTNVNSSHNVSFYFVPGLCLLGAKIGLDITAALFFNKLEQNSITS